MGSNVFEKLVPLSISLNETVCRVCSLRSTCTNILSHITHSLPRLDQLTVLVDQIIDVPEQFLEGGPQMWIQIEAGLH